MPSVGVDALRAAGRARASVRLLPVVHGRAARRATGRIRRCRGDGARSDLVRHDAEPESAGGGARKRDPPRAPRDCAHRARPLARKDARAAQDRGGVRDAGLHERWAARCGAAGRAQLRREPEQRHPHGRDARPLPGGPRPDDARVELATEPFPWNGRFSQYALVNSWPRPLQKPRPPVWVPGSGSPGTMSWTIEQSYAFVYLSWFGPTLTARRIFDRFWEVADTEGVPANPYRVGFVQSVVVSETDERAQAEYGRYVENHFRQGPEVCRFTTSGCPATSSRVASRQCCAIPGDFGLAAELKHVNFGRLVETGSVIAGSPATVRDQIVEFAKEFRYRQPARDAPDGRDAARPHPEEHPALRRGGAPTPPGALAGRGLGERLVADGARAAGRGLRWQGPAQPPKSAPSTSGTGGSS